MTPDRSRANDIDEARIEALGREVYGEGYEQFLVTPRRSLDGETPAALIARGDLEPVMNVLVTALEGNYG